MSDRQWEIMQGDESTLPKIHALYTAVHGKDISLDYLRWSYLQNPVAPSPLMLAYDASRDRLAGLYTVSPMRASLGGQQIKAAQSFDTMTHPDYRNQGIFTTLAKHCFEHLTATGYEMVYGFPNANSFPGFVNHLNWDAVGPVPQRKRLIFPALGSLNLALLPSASSRGECRPGIPKAAAIDGFFAAYNDEKRTVSLLRSADWLLWRYDAQSRRQARWHGIYTASGELLGFAVWNHTPDACFGSITEIWAHNPADYGVLLHAMMREAVALKLRSLCTYILHPTLATALLKCGFVTDPRSNRALQLCARALTTKLYPANIHTHDHWRIMGGDMDFL